MLQPDLLDRYAMPKLDELCAPQRAIDDRVMAGMRMKIVADHRNRRAQQNLRILRRPARDFGRKAWQPGSLQLLVLRRALRQEKAAHILRARLRHERKIGIFDVVAEGAAPDENHRARFRVKPRSVRKHMHDSIGFEHGCAHHLALQRVDERLPHRDGFLRGTFEKRNALFEFLDIGRGSHFTGLSCGGR